MTVDMTFWLSGKKYYLDYVNQRYAIFTEEWETVAEDVNFLLLLNKPIREWDNKSFHELVKEMLFND